MVDKEVVTTVDVWTDETGLTPECAFPRLQVEQTIVKITTWSDGPCAPEPSVEWATQAAWPKRDEKLTVHAAQLHNGLSLIPA